MTTPAASPQTIDPNRDWLRQTLARLACRGGKAVRNAPAGVSDFHEGEGLRTSGQILAFIGDLFDWALSIAMGRQKWQNSTPPPWEQEVTRFFTALKKFDDFLASSKPVPASLEKLFQGPIADVLMHVGQMAGAPVKGESYFVADIQTGRVDADQSPPKREF